MRAGDESHVKGGLGSTWMSDFDKSRDEQRSQIMVLHFLGCLDKSLVMYLSRG